MPHPHSSELVVQPLGSLPPKLVLPDDRAAAVWTQVAEAVTRHGFTVTVRELGIVELTTRDGIPSARLPKTGSFDGLEIAVSPELTLSEKIFTLLHLFGHSVQCCSPSEAGIVDDFFRTPRDSDDKLRVLANYEFRAAQFGLRLLHDLRIRDLGDWFATFVHTDHRMVVQTYLHGQAPPIAACLVTDGPRIEPAPLPADLQPQLIRRVSVAY